jgi:hypothetical protein
VFLVFNEFVGSFALVGYDVDQVEATLKGGNIDWF